MQNYSKTHANIQLMDNSELKYENLKTIFVFQFVPNKQSTY